MFSFIPIIGPIIDGIVSIFTTVTNAVVTKYQTDADVAKTAINASTTDLQTFKDDLGVKLCRDLILFPVAIWTSIITWDNIVVYAWPNLFLKVAPYPTELAFLPYAAMTFLFGINAINIWKAFR